MTTGPVEIHPGRDELATAAAGALLQRLADRQREGGLCHLGLTGGTIADQVHRRVAELSPESAVDWSRVVCWWSDERYVPVDSPDRNAGQARRALLDHVPVLPEHVHEMPAPGPGSSLEDAADAYAATLRADGGGEFDVLMLGVGDDGHVASLFPGRAEVHARDAIAVGVRDSPKPPPERISLTRESLCRSRAVWFLVSGAEKAEAVARARAGAPVAEVPAAGVTGRQETRWFLDSAAASALS